MGEPAPAPRDRAGGRPPRPRAPRDRAPRSRSVRRRHRGRGVRALAPAVDREARGRAVPQPRKRRAPTLRATGVGGPAQRLQGSDQLSDNRAPVLTPAQPALLDQVAAAVLTLPGDGVARVAIDGVDGAGKTMFADELGDRLASSGRPLIRASVDGFHHPRAIRYRRGRTSPEGFYRDSYDYARLKRVLLDPLGPGGDRRFRRAIFDVAADAPVEAAEERAWPGSI